MSLQPEGEQMGPWWKQRSVAAGVLLATALAGTALAQRQLLGDPRQFSDIPTEGFDYRRGVPVSEDDIWPVPFSRYDAAVEYTARRGWFEGYPDGSFPALGEAHRRATGKGDRAGVSRWDDQGADGRPSAVRRVGSRFDPGPVGDERDPEGVSLAGRLLGHYGATGVDGARRG